MYLIENSRVAPARGLERSTTRAAEPALVTSTDGVICDVTPRAEVLLQRARGGLIGERLANLVHPLARREFEHNLAEAVASGIPQTWNSIVVTDTGSLQRWRLTAALYCAELGCTMVAWSIEDVSRPRPFARDDEPHRRRAPADADEEPNPRRRLHQDAA